MMLLGAARSAWSGSRTVAVMAVARPETETLGRAEGWDARRPEPRATPRQAKDDVTFLVGWPSSKLRQRVSQYLGKGADASVRVV